VTVSPNFQDYINIALNCFALSAVVCLFVIFYIYEKESDELFDQVVWDNISTIVIALLIQFIGTGIDVVSCFIPL
jgi:uncharacterized membrane protein YGL010W